MAKAKKQLELKIVFDTNVIFTGSASDLFKKELIEFFAKYSTLSDIKITWLIPDVVIDERRYQMKKKGFEIIPSIKKLEKIIGHNLAITEEIIETRINETIEKQVSLYNVNPISIDVTKVNWETIIHNSCFRKPPFEDGEYEKGFRDSIILETVIQLINNSPSSKSICRIILLTNDKLLQEAFNERTKSNHNTSVLNSLEEIESLINVLSSEITEELISQIIDQVEKVFFETDNINSIYYKENIRQQIVDNYSNELRQLPSKADRRENLTWWISKPGFVKKEGQKIFWKNVISVESKAFKKQKEDYLSLLEKLTSNVEFEQSYKSPFGAILGQKQSEKTDVLVSSGKTKFEIIWCITLTTSKIIKNTKIERIDYIETVWE